MFLATHKHTVGLKNGFFSLAAYYTMGFVSRLCLFRFVVSGLTTGETYMFRVQAINELGLSDESQESAPLTVKAALSQ